MGRRARRDGGAVMSGVSGDALRGFLACFLPGLIVAMKATCAILRRFDNSTAFRSCTHERVLRHQGRPSASSQRLRTSSMSEVSGDAVRGFLACLFPGLIVAMTATCAILRRFDNSTAFRSCAHERVLRHQGRPSASSQRAAYIVAMTAAMAQERAAAAVPQM